MVIIFSRIFSFLGAIPSGTVKFFVTKRWLLTFDGNVNDIMISKICRKKFIKKAHKNTMNWDLTKKKGI